MGSDRDKMWAFWAATHWLSSCEHLSSVCLSIYLSICHLLSVFHLLSIYLSIYLSTYMSVHLNLYVCIHSLYLSSKLYLYMPTSIPILSIYTHTFICVYCLYLICLSLFIDINMHCISIFTYICIYVCLCLYTGHTRKRERQWQRETQSYYLVPLELGIEPPTTTIVLTYSSLGPEEDICIK
jgi:hypothetical protein